MTLDRDDIDAIANAVVALLNQQPQRLMDIHNEVNMTPEQRRQLSRERVRIAKGRGRHEQH